MAFAKPEWSRRRKLSDRTRIRSQIQITQAKKMVIVQKMSRNG
jgi:hypothetical protein